MKKKSLICVLIILVSFTLSACQMLTSIAQPVAQLEALQVQPTQIVLGPGEKMLLNLAATYSDGSQQEVDSWATEVQYSISHPDWVQIESGYLYVTEQAPSGGQVQIAFTYEGKEATVNVEVKYDLDETIAVMADGLAVVTNPAAYDVLVNKERNLPADYIPDDLIVPDISFPYTSVYEKMHMRAEAAHALEALFEAAAEAGYQLVGISGYRSYQTQQRVFNYQVNKHGSEEKANLISARPGQSEHQTGLAMDISCAKVANLLEFEFGELDEGKWVQEHCAEFGFIIRYPQDKEEITGYSYEPWHLRYVGPVLAQKIMSEGLTMEEYFIR